MFKILATTLALTLAMALSGPAMGATSPSNTTGNIDQEECYTQSKVIIGMQINNPYLVVGVYYQDENVIAFEADNVPTLMVATFENGCALPFMEEVTFDDFDAKYPQ